MNLLREGMKSNNRLARLGARESTTNPANRIRRRNKKKLLGYVQISAMSRAALPCTRRHRQLKSAIQYRIEQKQFNASKV